MKKLITIFTMIMLLTGCATSEKMESLTCKAVGNGEGGNPTMTGTYKYTVGENPKMVSFVIDTETVFDDGDFTKEFVESSVKTVEELYKTYEGIDYGYKSTDTKLTEHIEVDLSVVSKDVLESLNNSINPDAFNLENFKANMDAIGWTCE